jgi:hypothetical protein
LPKRWRPIASAIGERTAFRVHAKSTAFGRFLTAGIEGASACRAAGTSI